MSLLRVGCVDIEPVDFVVLVESLSLRFVLCLGLVGYGNTTILNMILVLIFSHLMVTQRRGDETSNNPQC